MELAFDEARATRAERFFERMLCHTKGRWAGQPFHLTDWQRDDLVRPLFGTVRYDEELDDWVRLYRVAWLELARKNGKSEFLAGCGLYLLIADGEAGAEIYGAAADRDQAAIVWEVAQRMVELSRYLSARLRIFKQSKRIVDERTGSYYRVLPADAAGNLGLNPHGILFDEVIAQPSRELWDALRTAAGARTQPLMIAATTAGNDPASFAAKEHAEMEKVADDPDRAPHTFVFMRNTDAKADAFDEANWSHANPALGEFLSAQALRDEAIEARNDPAKENAFRQFRLNQWVQQATRWMPLHLWDESSTEVWPSPAHARSRLKGRRAWGGLDLSSVEDLTAWSLVVELDERGEDGQPRYGALWRFFCPEEQVRDLDRHTGGDFSVWVRQGWVTATEGNVIDYEAVLDAIAADAEDFRIVDISADRWMLEPVRQRIVERTGTEVFPIPQTFQGMGPAMKQLRALVRARRLEHGRNPVARWNVDSTEVKRDDAENVKPVKPERKASGRRIDGTVALALAIDAGVVRARPPRKRGVAGF
ncbi:MAG TPA: terminase TerL endonuclease subunit [Candidatus Limnocylindria bacterium]|nr:terminase TerL endonuclease subunit [Candidatus Limnocylindria bacterium]